MNKIKKMLLTIIAIIAVIMTISVTVLEATDVVTPNEEMQLVPDMMLQIGDKMTIIPGSVLLNPHFYCVAEDQKLPDDPTKEYAIIARVKIDGDNAYFYEPVQNADEADVFEESKDENGNIVSYSYYKLHKVTNPMNNLLAAVLATNEEIHDVSYNEISNQYLSGALDEDLTEEGATVMAVHLLWDDWATATGAHDYGIRSSNATGIDEIRAKVNEWIAQVEKVASYFNFQADILFGVCAGFQNLIYVNVDPPIETTEKCTIVKQWEDGEYKNIYRPSSIKLDLHANVDGKDVIVDTVDFDTGRFNGNYNQEIIFNHTVDEYFTASDNDGTVTIRLKVDESSNTWSCTWDGLRVKDSKEELEIKYWAEENQKTIETLEPTYKCTFNAQGPLNILQTTNVTVKKVWEDNNNENLQRPKYITMLLKGNGKTLKEITLTGNPTDSVWQTIEEVPVYDTQGKVNKFTIEEVNVPAPYMPIIGNAVESTSGNGFVITVKNIIEIKPIDVTVKKVWNDGENKLGKRPTSITVTLTDANGNPVTKNANGEAINPVVTLSEENKWTYTYKNLNKDIVYNVKETIDSKDYISSISKPDAPEGDYTIEIINTEGVYITVNKEWINDYEDERPEYIDVSVVANELNMTQSARITAADGWKYTFPTKFPKYQENGQLVTFSVKEVKVPDGYKVEKVTPTADGYSFTITNISTKTTNVTVEKVWNDDNNRDGVRLNSVEVELYATNVEGIEKQKVTLNESNNWKHTFNNLVVYKDETEINYNVREITNLNGDYTSTNSISGDVKNGYKFIVENKHEPEKVDIDVTKVWDDFEDIDDLRPESITIKLLENGADTGKTLILNESNSWKGTFKDLCKYKNEGQQCIYTVQEAQVSGYESPIIEIGESRDVDGRVTYPVTVKNMHKPNYDGYVEITGRVWVDEPTGKGNNINGTYGDDKDTTIQGDEKVKVILKDANGNSIKSTYTDEKGELTRTDYALITSSSDGTYTIRVNYDNSKNVYKLYEDEATVRAKLETAYVEFEYDGVKYTTVASAATGANTSKAVENENQRLEYDRNNTMITSQTNRNDWDGTITAKTNGILSYEQKLDSRDVVVKYCHGTGTEHTNTLGAWKEIVTKNEKCNKNNQTPHTHTYGVDVDVISNINLGLFRREEPDVAIFSDLTKVQVTMKGQQYTYLYGVRGKEANDVGLKVKFQNKDTYTYKRPVNPADIAYVNIVNNNAMSVLVTYEVKVANLSTTLPVTVHNIINSFDSEYTLNTEGWTITDANGFKQATSGDLNITVNPQTESAPIELTYTVSLEAIRNLLNEQATLNNAVEISSYSTKYGKDTLYAEQRTGERNNMPYAGYDYNSHPGNAGIFINNEGRLEAAILEDDTDIAPSFVLCKDEEPKTLAGTIWEDVDANPNDEERLGNGYQDDTEKNVQNVKVELFKPDGTLVKLYNKETKQFDRDAVTYTDANGNYSLDGVVTGEECYIKYTYGDDTEKLGHEATTMDGGITKVNARNYKSTIIVEESIKNILSKDYANFSEQDKYWVLTHNDRYSVAVDNMNERLQISDLQYSNINNTQNMIAYTKPFIVKLEFDNADESSSIKTDGEHRKDENGKIVLSGDIIDAVNPNATNILDKLDFGIAERPREDLFAEKTITYFKIILANGQVLTEGNPNDVNANIDYAKTMGFRQEINNGEDARNALQKQILVELDAELIQGAQLDVTYAVKITNNNELDYDYGVYEDYRVEFENANKKDYDKYITKNSKANYYYYGNKQGLNELPTVIEMVDYMTADIVYNEDNTQWINIDVEELYTNGLISADTYNAIKVNQYNVFRNASSSAITLARHETFEKTMTASKVLSNKDYNVYDNNLEIIKIDGKTARTIQESDNGKQIKKTYTPGNYVPNEGEFEQDDDIVKLMITPPTGIINNIMTYVIVILIGFTVVGVGIFFIKKKVLTK